MSARIAFILALFLAVPPPVFAADDAEVDYDAQVDLSEEPVPFLEDEDIPRRVGPIIELGRGINQPGELAPGIEIFTGAVWQPALWVYGFSQTAYTKMDGPNPPANPQRGTAEIATRLNVFANLQLTGTERVLLHIRPLDRGGDYTRYKFSPDGDKDQVIANSDIRLFFAEGEIAEMFPRWDPDDRRNLDIGVSLGLQPVFFQNGILINDNILSAAVAQKSIIFPGTSGARAALFYGWDNIHLGNTSRDKEDDARLIGLFTEADMPKSTLVELDFAYVDADDKRRGDQFNAGIGATTHRGAGNYALRLNYSQHFNNEEALARRMGTSAGETSIVDDYDGFLLTGEYSREVSPHRDLIYANAYRAFDSFAPIARNAETAGPLTMIGITYAGVGWGAYRPALLPRGLESAGFAVGYQKFFDNERANLVLELAARKDMRGSSRRAKDGARRAAPGVSTTGRAIGLRFQRKFWNRFMWQVDAHYARYADCYGMICAARPGRDHGFGVRSEIRVNF
jgi:hypothetical protein